MRNQCNSITLLIYEWLAATLNATAATVCEFLLPRVPFTVQTSRVIKLLSLTAITLSFLLVWRDLSPESSNTLMHSIYSWERRRDNGSGECVRAGKWKEKVEGLFWIGPAHGGRVGGPMEMPGWWMGERSSSAHQSLEREEFQKEPGPVNNEPGLQIDKFPSVWDFLNRLYRVYKMLVYGTQDPHLLLSLSCHNEMMVKKWNLSSQKKILTRETFIFACRSILLYRWKPKGP